MYLNPSARSWKSEYIIDPTVLPFHKALPNYEESPLLKLPQSFSQKLGVGSILVKDESHRFGLPAYKILGASWGCYRTVAKRLGLPLTTPLEEVKEVAQHANYRIYTATDGNWGRSVARMAKVLGTSAYLYVPKVMIESTRRKIAHEGATVIVVDGDYDQAVKEAERVCLETGGILIEDTAWPGYEEIPQWVVDGYSTMMVEIDQQAQALVGKRPDLVVCPVGAGSLAQAVVAHFKHVQPSAAILTVEADTAASLKTSLENGHITPIPTEDTIMCGMNCGTVSLLAWPFLRDGVDASIVVTDDEDRVAQDALKEMHINIGPCGAATLAALTKACKEGKEKIYIGPDSIVVLLGTEAPRGSTLDTA
ncbi:diaminopropionate ammonia-lyase, partial [Lecanoromycetidae sp. Uapishka_2]